MDRIKQNALNGFQLKLIGLVLMVFDHIHQFFNFTGNVPIIFKWLGRVVAPIFMFLTVEGYVHTRDKKKYMLRLYIGSVFMGAFNSIIPRLLPRMDKFTVNNNIFSTLLMMVIYMAIIDYRKKAKEQKDKEKILLSTVFAFMPFIIGSLMIFISDMTGLDFLKYLVPNVFLVEGGPLLVLLGLIFYLTRDDLDKLIKYYIIFCAVFLLSSLAENGFSLEDIFFNDYQWMMVFSIYFFKKYNGEKGRGLKYLFYIFYIM